MLARPLNRVPVRPGPSPSAGAGRLALVLCLGVALACVAAADAAAQSARNSTPGADPNPDKRCLQCHAQPHIAELTPRERRSMVGTWLGEGDAPAEAAPPADVAPGLDPELNPDPDAPATRPGLYITRDHLAGSVHADTACVECHEDAARLPHAPPLNLKTCATACHADVAAEFAEGEHKAALDHHDALAPGCVTCHGGHDILPIDARSSPMHRLNSLYLCGDCHQQHRPNGHNADPKGRITRYLDSTHARGVSRAGLLSAATCADCHGAHAVHKSADPRSPVFRANVPETCASCHAGVLEVFDASVHGTLASQGDERAPVCTDCHTAHSITRATTPEFALDLINECGHCHDSPDRDHDRLGTYYETYRSSYHGQVTELGSTRAARCSDCHGAHDILPLADPASRVSQENLIATCAQAGCHPGANANFVKFDPHADYRDRKNYPVLFGVWLYFLIVMSTVFTVFGVHTLLWFLRDMIDRIRRGAPPKHAHASTAIRRFSTLNRVNHALVIITFFGLTATGIPLVFSHQPWARSIAELVGGVHAAGLLHRVFATMLVINFVLHFAGLAINFHRRPGSAMAWALGPNSLIPKWRDVTDFLAMFRWFIVGGRKPSFGRWTYWEKFDYWAEVFGSFIIGGTGFLLWFPLFFSQFIPGWAFNIAMIIHGYEALLAIGFIFTIHFFNAHLRPGTFPVDDVIFTGCLSEEELRAHRPEEYRVLVESGRLDDLRVPAPDRSRRPFLIALAVFCVSFGLLLLTFIILGGLSLLL